MCVVVDVPRLGNFGFRRWIIKFVTAKVRNKLTDASVSVYFESFESIKVCFVRLRLRFLIENVFVLIPKSKILWAFFKSHYVKWRDFGRTNFCAFTVTRAYYGNKIYRQMWSTYVYCSSRIFGEKLPFQLTYETSYRRLYFPFISFSLVNETNRKASFLSKWFCRKCFIENIQFVYTRGKNIIYRIVYINIRVFRWIENWYRLWSNLCMNVNVDTFFENIDYLQLSKQSTE